METNKNTGWIVAGILAVIVVIMGFMMWGDWKKETDVNYILEEGEEDITNARLEIERECGVNRNSPECQDALSELADLLRQFGRDIDYATTTETEVY